MSDIQIPQCFIDLDVALGEEDQSDDVVHAMQSPKVRLAENLCRRMADVDWYAKCVKSTMQEENMGKATFLCSTWLVGYFSSCKSLIDAAAITISRVLRLGLSNREQDFGKGRFWNSLREASRADHDRYAVYRSVANSVISWRDAAVHRQSPFILPSGTTGERPRDQQKIWLINSPEPTIDGNVITVEEGKDVRIDPLSLHEDWRDEFVSLCGAVCDDIRRWRP